MQAQLAASCILWAAGCSTACCAVAMRRRGYVASSLQDLYPAWLVICGLREKSGSFGNPSALPALHCWHGNVLLLQWASLQQRLWQLLLDSPSIIINNHVKPLYLVKCCACNGAAVIVQTGGVGVALAGADGVLLYWCWGSGVGLRLLLCRKTPDHLQWPTSSSYSSVHVLCAACWLLCVLCAVVFPYVQQLSECSCGHPLL